MRTILELHFTENFQGETELYHDEHTQAYIKTDGTKEQILTKQEHRKTYKTLEHLRKQTNQKWHQHNSWPTKSKNITAN